jgi:riboflavin biosynthesis pyrimidine reductase
MVVLSPSGRVEGLGDLLAGDWPLSIVVSPDAFERVRESLAAIGAEANIVELQDFSPDAVLEYLAAQGFEKVLLEFGPRLAGLWSTPRPASAARRGCAIDEVCLTTTGLSADRIDAGDAGAGVPHFMNSAAMNLEDDIFVGDIHTRFRRFTSS